MISYALRYATLMGTVLVLFANFVACGAQLYKVSLEDDMSPPATYAARGNANQDPDSPEYGIHAKDGWTSLPITFVVDAQFTQAEVQQLKAAMKTWERATGLMGGMFRFVGAQTSVTGDSFPDLYSSLKDTINGHYSENNWGKLKKPSEVLATTIWKNPPENLDAIATADIRYNREHFLIGDSFALKAQGTREVVDLESLALHELGHFLGLTHTSKTDDSLSIMNPHLFIGEGLASRKLSKGDIVRIQKIYGCSGVACDVDALFAAMELGDETFLASQDLGAH